ncbi:MAG: PAS domain-containing hybrid sensor histidine kinase/response regulator [Pseudomonadota bacterium]
MIQGWTVVAAALIYVVLLFVVASFGDRRKSKTTAHRSRPVIYALSLAVYCTSWTFFGSVGLAATSGLDFLAIYLGPVLMVTVGYPIMSRIVRLAKSERITSIADFISARYGKSVAVASFATLIAVVGAVPYIALQLKAVSFSVDIMVSEFQPFGPDNSGLFDTPFAIAVLLAIFAILFGTRHADATEHQDGLILAVAMESVVKLGAFLVAGLFVTFIIFDGFGDLIMQAQNSAFVLDQFQFGVNPGNFAILTLLSFFAAILLPRQFHVGVVENRSQSELRKAAWLFPLYLVLINLFVVPVALAGLLKFGSSIDADNFVLALPIDAQAPFVSMLTFLGGLSAATAMVIVACVALAIMISNTIVLPILLRFRAGENNPFERDMGKLLLYIRRTAIFVVMMMAYAYFQVADETAALASIGLLSFAAVAQFAPAFFGGLVWRRASARGALFGMGAGFLTWVYTLFLPTVLDASDALLVSGPFGLDFLRPQSLFGTELAPLTHGVLWSLSVNALCFVLASYSRPLHALERLQAAIFVPRDRLPAPVMGALAPVVTQGAMMETAARYLGNERAQRAFQAYASESGSTLEPEKTADSSFFRFSEQLLASAIGAASARLVLSLLLQKHEASPHSTLKLLDDASEALRYNRDLLQTAIDQVDQGICVFDSNFHLSSWNRQFRKLLDLPPDIGQAGTPLTTIARSIASLSINLASDPDGAALASKLIGERSPWQLRNRKQGRILEVMTSPMPGGGLVVSWSDMTERVNAAAALKLANETLEKRVEERTQALTESNRQLAEATDAADRANIGKTRFLAAVGHDILQPLNAARLYSSSLKERLDSNENQRLAENIDESLASVDEILGAVLAISRLDTGALKPEITDFKLDKLLQQIRVEFQPFAEEKGLKLEIRESGAVVRSDRNLLRRLVQNLVSNAIKYTRDGKVTLLCKKQDGLLTIDVHDTGIGIEPKNLAFIYNEFHRLKSGKQQAQGLGLGLSIVERISKALDMPVSVESVPGRGSVFSVHIPLGNVSEIPMSQPVEATDSAAHTVGGTDVLCIDNEPAILDGMRSLLSNWGCYVRTAENGRDALELVRDRAPDIVLADFHLEDETGLQLIGEIRAVCGENLPAAIVSADRSSDLRNATDEANITLINKPVKPAALRAVLNQHMAHQTAAE